MNKLEVEQLNGGDPVIDGHVWLDVVVVEHPTYILSVHFYHQISSSNDMHSEGT